MKVIHLLFTALLILTTSWVLADTPHNAARHGDLETLREYRFNGKDLFLSDERGFIPYELAALHANPDSTNGLQQHVEVMLWLKEYKPEKHHYGKASISLVQSGLNALGYHAGQADGQLSKKTQNAIREYQADNDLAETGKLGPQWLGTFYQDVLRDIQYKLTKLGHNTYGNDGLMGKKTRQAIFDYRKEKKLSFPNYPHIDALLISSINDKFIKKEKREKVEVARITKKEITSQILYTQTGLYILGYRIGKVDGHIGSKTTNAIKAFQKRNKLSSTGNIDNKTLSTLKIALLKDTQKKLNAFGYAVGKPDGKMGNKTIKALRKYRKSKKLSERGGIDIDLLNILQRSYASAENRRKEKKDVANSSYLTRYAQAGLRTLGHPISVDGMMGSSTKKSIKAFQKRYKIKRTGGLDKNTLAKMHTIFLKETQPKLSLLGYHVGKPDGRMGARTQKAIKQFRHTESMSGTGADAALIIAVDDAYDSRSVAKKKNKKQRKPQKKTQTSNKIAERSSKITNISLSNGRSAKGRMAFKRQSGRVVGCSIAGRTIPIAWCEPFYPLPRNNHCEASFRAGSNKVVNLWCK